MSAGEQLMSTPRKQAHWVWGGGGLRTLETEVMFLVSGSPRAKNILTSQFQHTYLHSASFVLG